MTNKRTGFTLLELTVTAAIIGVLVVIVAQCIALSLRERARMATRLAATELAANVLEEARAQPLAKLDKTWAEGRKIPSELAGLLHEGKIDVAVETVSELPSARRVSVEVRWRFEEHLPLQSVRLTTLLSGREAKGGAK